MSRYTEAREIYRSFCVDTEDALQKMQDITISLHCWQGDDVVGFDCGDAASGGIQTTGSYPGKARTPEELMHDMDYVIRMLPGKKKLNLHAS